MRRSRLPRSLETPFRALGGSTLSGQLRRATADSAICAASRPNGEDVDHLLIRSSIEEDSPLADAKPPEALWPAEALDVAVGKLADRRGVALAILPAQLAEGLQGTGADLDPPLAQISQRSAPPRPLTKRFPVCSAPP
jgi:hypothetical protein